MSQHDQSPLFPPRIAGEWWRCLQVQGRLNRAQYLLRFALLTGTAYLVLPIIGTLPGAKLGQPLAWLLFAGLQFVFSAKRCHDLGRSGAWGLLTFVPIAGLFYLVFLLAAPGENGANRFGPSPQSGNRAPQAG